MKQKGYNNIDLYAFLMLASKYSRRLQLLGRIQWLVMQGKNIPHGVITLHENVQELHKKNRVILKIDFEKAYDKIKWYFF
jgi:hypothetical protein